MSRLPFIPPFKCKYCEGTFKWSETSHEENCAKNPKNQCYACGKSFSGDYQNPAVDKLRIHLKESCVEKRRQMASMVYEIIGPPTAAEQQQPQEHVVASSGIFDDRIPVFKGGEPSLHPRAPSCSYCGLNFGGTPNSIFKCDAHESNCRHNPDNQCPFCGLGFSGWGTNAAQNALKKHFTHCKLNINNRETCKFCGLTFQNISNGLSASTLVEEHEQNCRGNPSNRCPFCDIIFSGPQQLERHFLTCPLKKEADFINYRYESSPTSPFQFGYNMMDSYGFYQYGGTPVAPNNYFAYGNSSPASHYQKWANCSSQFCACPNTSYANYPQNNSWGYNFWAGNAGGNQMNQPFTAVPSDESTSQEYTEAQAEIAGIDAKLAFYRGSALRTELRKLMLQWHPDKNTHVDSKLSCTVFSHIRERWNQITGIPSD